MKWLSLSIFFILLFGFMNVYAQRKNSIRIVEEEGKIYSKKKTPSNFQLFKNELYLEYVKNGYCFVSIEQIDSATLKIKKGDRFKQLQIIDGNSSKSYKINEVSKIMQEKIQVDANNGFPFSSCKLDSLEFEKKPIIRAKLSYTKGPFYTIKKIIVRGETVVDQKIIEAIINIKVGDPYREKNIRNIDASLKNCPFINLIKPSEILFTSEGVELYCYVKNLKSSSINGVLGVQPNNTTQKIGLTGDVQLKLENILQKGEYFFINWKNVLPQTSSLLCNLKYPYLFRSPFGIQGNLFLSKRDSTFLELSSEVNVNYKANRFLSLNSVYKNYQNTRLSSTGNVEFNNNANVNTNFFGIKMDFSTIDNRINPSKGQNIKIEALSGLRKINQIENARNTVFQLSCKLEHYLRINNHHVIKLQSNLNGYFADTVYTNERFRIGGINSLRGFNEESLFSTSYIINTLEYRYRLDISAYAFVFFDHGILRDKTKFDSMNLTNSFGLGFAYNTNIGMFNIVGAYGTSKYQPLDIQEAKIHFGYVAFF